jgi:hypothetical protein
LMDAVQDPSACPRRTRGDGRRSMRDRRRARMSIPTGPQLGMIGGRPGAAPSGDTNSTENRRPIRRLPRFIAKTANCIETGQVARGRRDLADDKARFAGNSAYSIPAYSPRLGKRSPLARAPPVQNPTVPFGRPPGSSITGRHRNGDSRRPRGRSIEVAGHSIGRADPLLDHPCHLDDSRRVTHPSAHLVTGRHHGRRLGRPVVDPHTPTSARRGGVRPGLRQPDRPQPPIHAGRLHSIHHGSR